MEADRTQAAFKTPRLECNHEGGSVDNKPKVITQPWTTPNIKGREKKVKPVKETEQEPLGDRNRIRGGHLEAP